MSAPTGSRLSSYMRKSESLKSRFTLPEKLKGGRVEKYVNYWKGVKTDYKEALKELAQSSKQKPIKATLIGGTFLFAWYANHHNPDEESFKSELIKVNNDLTAVPESHRNRVSTNHQLELNRANNSGVLRHWNLGIFSIIWKDNYNAEFGHFKSTCKYLKVGYTDLLFKGKYNDNAF